MNWKKRPMNMYIHGLKHCEKCHTSCCMCLRQCWWLSFQRTRVRTNLAELPSQECLWEAPRKSKSV